MINYEFTDKAATIFFTVEEPSTKQDPFFLQNIMYDPPSPRLLGAGLPFDLLTIQITIPRGMQAFIIDDLHFEETGALTNKIELILEESSQLHYQLFVANHHLCEACKRKELYDCQQVPQKFEKELSIKLIQPNAQAFIKCHYLGDDESKFKLTTTQHHQASDTESYLTVKGVLDDQAKLVSDNTIIVDKKLEGVSAKQENKNLMLNKNARVISIPKLKINSQKVSCSHGATVGPLDPDSLFYLQSRGLGMRDAEQVLVEAFLGVD